MNTPDEKPDNRQPMPLAMAGAGQQVELACITGGKDLLHRLAEMGLTPGTTFSILNKGQPGPFIILLKDTRLILGRGMAHSIMVYPVVT
jgi:Fe2+ transport system protein FeoA